MKIRIIHLTLCLFIIHGLSFLLASSMVTSAAEKEVAIDLASKKSLNVFLTNFSEVYLEPFKKGKISDAALIEFGIRHNEINNPQFIQKLSASQRRIAAQYVDASIQKYFGLPGVKHKTYSKYLFDKKYYLFPASTNTNIGVSEIRKMIDMGNGYFSVDFNIYPAPANKSIDIEAYLKKLNKDTTDFDIMKAIIRKVVENKKERYILVEYTIVESIVY